MEYTICDEKDFQSSQIWNIRTNNLFRSLGHSAKHQIYTKIYITINKLFVVEDILIYPQIIRECSTPRTRAPTCRHTHTHRFQEIFGWFAVMTSECGISTLTCTRDVRCECKWFIKGKNEQRKISFYRIWWGGGDDQKGTERQATVAHV